MIGPLFKMLMWSGFLVAVGYVSLGILDIQEDGMRRVVLGILTFFFYLSQWEFLFRFYRYFLNVVIVTDKKIHRIKKTLLTIDDHQSIDLRMLQDIHKSQHGPVQNLLGFGSLTLEAQESVLKIHFTPRISKTYEALMHLKGSII